MSCKTVPFVEGERELWSFKKELDAGHIKLFFVWIYTVKNLGTKCTMGYMSSFRSPQPPPASAPPPLFCKGSQT